MQSHVFCQVLYYFSFLGHELYATYRVSMLELDLWYAPILLPELNLVDIIIHGHFGSVVVLRVSLFENDTIRLSSFCVICVLTDCMNQ